MAGRFRRYTVLEETDVLNEQEITDELASRLRKFDLLELNSPQPLQLDISYGEDEPVLSIKLHNIYEMYQEDPSQLDTLLQPFVVEIGWTVQPPRYSARDIFEHARPVLKDLLRTRSEDDAHLNATKGPVVFKELVSRPEEFVVVEFVIERDGNRIELRKGDVLPCFPKPSEMATVAAQNLARIAAETGLTATKFPVEEQQTKPWMVGIKDNSFAPYAASLILVPDVMRTLEKDMNAESGLLAIIPSQEWLLIATETDDVAVCEMGMLAKYLKDRAEEPVSSFVWHFTNGNLDRVQTVDLHDGEGEN
jgi:hypothetical protein